MRVGVLGSNILPMPSIFRLPGTTTCRGRASISTSWQPQLPQVGVRQGTPYCGLTRFRCQVQLPPPADGFQVFCDRVVGLAKPIIICGAAGVVSIR